MKNQWLVWAFIASVIVIVIVAFNSENQRKSAHYTEEVPAEVQYEDETAGSQAAPVKADVQKVQAAVSKTTTQVSQKVQEVYQDAKTQTTTVAKTGVDADQVVTEAELPAPEITSFSDVAYTIQISSVKELSDAQKVLADVLKKNYPGFVAERNLGDKGIWYRVYVGKFATKSEADAELQSVKKDFASAFVIAPVRKKVVQQ